MGFASLLDDPSPPQSRGRLGVGRVLADQLQAEGAGQGSDPSVTPLVLPGVLIPPTLPEAAQVKDAGPYVLPGFPDGATLTESAGPHVLPGTPDSAAGGKTDGAQVLPGVPDGSAAGVKFEHPLILPRDAGPSSKAEQPLVLPAGGSRSSADALGLLAATTGQARVDGAAETIRRLVSQAPQVSQLADPEEAGAPDAQPISVTPSGDSMEAQTGPASTAGREGQPSANAAAARPEAAATPRPVTEAGDASQPGSEVPPEDGIEILPSAARETVASQPSRPDAAAVQRQSFDAITQVAAQIIRRLEGRSTRFEMELHPASLGRVDVRLDIDAEGRVAARLAFDNPAAAADLRGRADELRRNLEEAGFQLADDALDFADREGRRGDTPDRDPFMRSTREADLADAEAQPVLRSLNRLGLDVRI